MNKNKEQEVVGIFLNKEDMDKALHALLMKFPRDAMSVLGSEESLKKELGEAHPKPDDAISSNKTPTEAPAAPESITIGEAAAVGTSAYVGAVGTALAMGAAVSLPVTIAVASVAGIATGSVGAVLTKLFSDRYDESIAQQIEAGGLLLWVRVQSDEEIADASEIMMQHNASKVERV